MFRELMNFSYQRTALQAVGRYLTFLIIGIFIGAIAGGILAIGASSSHAKMLGFHDWNELSA